MDDPLAIHTLDPSRLQAADFVDLSDIKYPRIRASLPNDNSYYGSNCFSTAYSYEHKGTPFPSGSHGFLYYHVPMSNVPPMAGEVRFRLTSRDDPALFLSGVDLIKPNGMPWSIPLLRAAPKVTRYRCLCQMLVNDGLITPALLEKCDTMISGAETSSRSRFIHSLGQLFDVDFHTAEMAFFTCHDDVYQRCRIRGLFAESSTYKKPVPYHGKQHSLRLDGAGTYHVAPIGTALCCFERSFLPWHQGSRTIVMRIVRITSPVRCAISDYNGYMPRPVEGELHRRGCGAIWSLNVDKSKLTGLRGLFRDE